MRDTPATGTAALALDLVGYGPNENAVRKQKVRTRRRYGLVGRNVGKEFEGFVGEDDSQSLSKV